nr:GLPGLI family protein [uncultured Carboxylicivirga sp.]
MRRSYLLLTTFLLIISSYKPSAQTQNGVVITDKAEYIATYRYEYQEDSTNIESRKQKEMCLLIGKISSQFAHNSIFKMDSMFFYCPDINNPESGLKIGKQIVKNSYSYHTKYRIVKTKNSRRSDLYEVMSGKYYHLPEEITFNWQLVNQPDTFITYYICKEARTTFRGRHYRAWYTLSIPISDGPYKFKGLPGMIVRIEDIEKEHCFTLTSFEKINYDKSIYVWNKKFIKIDAKQYLALKHNETLESINKYGNNQFVNLTPEKRGSVQAKIASRNNLLEKQ